jgi:hypothetical protein
MESLKRRLKYYGIGFGFGIIFLVFFFQNRGCSWLPGNRVKNSIMDRLIVVSEDTQKKMDEKGLSTEDLVMVLNDGDVDFGQSEKDKKSKVYILEKEGVKFAFTLPYESFISEAFVGVKNAEITPTKSGYGDILHFPADEHLVFPDSTDLMTCQQDKLGLISPKKILDLLNESGKIDFAKSDFTVRPKPIHYLVFTKDDKEVGAKVIWYKNKLNITSFEAEGLEDCLK